MFFVQTSTLPPRMHQKLTKHGRFCKQNNQLPTKTHVELKNNSIVPPTTRESGREMGRNLKGINFHKSTQGFLVWAHHVSITTSDFF
jgi:hypothetical protein